VILQGKDRPLKLIEAEMPRLEKARRALNSYVHPNYGSHIAALFPERASPALLLLEAVIAVYEAFFSLSWTEQPVRGRAVPTGIGALESWPRSVRRLQWRTLPEMQRTAGDPVLAHVIKCPALIEWLTKNRSDVTDMLRDPTAATLLEGLPQRAAGGATRDEALHYQMWEGATAVDVLHLASARRAEQLLADEFPSGAPATTDQVRWLRFNALSLQLAMLLDQLKAALFKTQLVRQIAQGNGLGVMLCVRSLIEHRALVVWLPQKIAASLDALAGSLQAANPLPQIAAEVEQPLVNFLIAQAKESNEERRSWVIDERGVVRTAWLNLSNVIEAAFPKNDRFRTLYAIASATMHARSGRGSDLLLSASNVRMQARRIGLLVLERLCDWDEEMDHLSAALVLSMRLEHAASFGGTASATTDLVAQQVFGHVERVLVAGADFEGEGTSDSPFRLGAHLEFYQGSYALLRQFGVNVGDCPRMPAESTAGYLCDRWRAPKRDYWFTIPSLGPTAA